MSSIICFIGCGTIFLAKNVIDIRNANIALLSASYSGDIKTVESSIKKGANINHVNDLGTTALMFASSAGNFKIAELLIKEKANIHYKSRYTENTALDFAYRFGHEDVVKLLKENGAENYCYY